MGQLDSGNFTHACDALTFRLKRRAENHQELFPRITTTTAWKSCMQNLKGQNVFLLHIRLSVLQDVRGSQKRNLTFIRMELIRRITAEGRCALV